MKRTIKLAGIIALVAVIGFSMAACDDGGGGPGGGPGGGGTVWTAVDASSIFPNGDTYYPIKAIAFGNGVFVAGNSSSVGIQSGGENGEMAYSADGRTWGPISLSNTAVDGKGISFIAYFNSKFFARDDPFGVLYYTYNWVSSADGITWANDTTLTLTGSGRFVPDSFAYGNSMFASVMKGGSNAYYSANGSTWTHASTDFGSTAYFNDIAFGNGVFVAAGTVLCTSTNGTTWDRQSFGIDFFTKVNAIAFGNGIFVAGSDNGKIATSTDGTTWTAVSNSTFGTTAITDIAFGNGIFVAGGDNGKIATSTDGTTWTAASDSTFGTTPVTSIVYGNGTFVAVGYNSTDYRNKIAYWQPGN